MQMIAPSGDELVEDALVRRGGEAPVRRRSTSSARWSCSASSSACWYFMHHWGLEHIFHKRQLPDAAAGTTSSTTRSCARSRSPTASTVIAAQRPVPGAVGDDAADARSASAISIVLGMALAVRDDAGPLARAQPVAVPGRPAGGADPRHRRRSSGAIFGYEDEHPDHRVRDHLDRPDRVEHAVRAALGRARPARPVHAQGRRRRGRASSKLQFPAALPAIFTGLPHLGRPRGHRHAVVGELFNRQGAKGIGILMDEYRSRNQFTYTYGRPAAVVAARHRRLLPLRLAAEAVIGTWHESTTGA